MKKGVDKKMKDPKKAQKSLTEKEAVKITNKAGKGDYGAGKRSK